MCQNQDLIDDAAAYELYCLDPEKFVHYSPVYTASQTVLQRIIARIKQQLERITR